MEELPEWLRAPRPSRSTNSNMAALSLIHFLPSSSASVNSRIEQFEHLTSSSSESRQSSSSRTMLGREMSKSSVARVLRPLSVPVACSQCCANAESRQGIHFDDTSSESDSPSKFFLLLGVLTMAKSISEDYPLVHFAFTLS